jgi:hypothetical protein
MAQGIRNRELGEIFLDEENPQKRYILTDIQVFSGENYDDIISQISNIVGENNFKIANKVAIKTKDRVKGAAFVQLTRKKTKEVFNLVRLYGRPITQKADMPVWAGKDLLDDFHDAYGIKPRLKSSFVTQSAYQPAKVDFAELFANSQKEIASDNYRNPQDILEKLLQEAKKDRTKLGKVIYLALMNLKTGFGTPIVGGAAFKKEVNIYASEFIVPLAIALNKTAIPLQKTMLKINTVSNAIGFDAAIKDMDSGKEYLISVKQGGSAKKFGAYGSVAFIKHIIEEKRASLQSKIEKLPLYEKLLDIILGTAAESSSTDDDKAIELVSKRKTYKSLFAVARQLEVPEEEIALIVQILNNTELPIEQKIGTLNKFALKVYDQLNKTKWFKEVSNFILGYINFVQAKLITTTTREGSLVIQGVQVDTTENKSVDFSAKKSYFGNKLATGHGGFLLKEIFEETESNDVNREELQISTIDSAIE